MGGGMTMGHGRDALMERLLEGPYLVVDVLPERVPAGSPGSFFEVEELLLNDAVEMGRIAKSARHIALKLACYFKIEAFDTSNGEWMDGVAAVELAELVEGVVKGGRGGVNVLLPDEGCLLSIEGGSLNMTAYGESERFRALLAKLAESEGLFCWEGEAGR